MTKKKKVLIVFTILLVVIIAFIGGQAYAKYVSEVRGEGIAEVATWNFKVNGQNEQVEQINLVSTCDNETLVNNKIAPGTSGSFNIIVDATGSEVGINYDISFTEENDKPQNLKFEYNGEKYDSIKELQDGLSGTINANDENKVKTLNIKWEWNFETGDNAEEIKNNDLIDTKDAQTIQNYTFNVIVTGTQVEPQV